MSEYTDKLSQNGKKFVNDMRKVLEFEKLYGKLEYTDQMNTGKLILDAVEKGLIETTRDLVYICNELPELTNEICGYFDIYVFNKKKRKTINLRRLRRAVNKENKEQSREKTF